MKWLTPEDKEAIEADKRLRQKELAEAFKNNEPLPAVVSLKATAYPPRPIIKKDKKEIARIYGI